jgi:sugar lactone lactonase YvrE
VAVDSKGNLFFTDQNAVLRLDATTGLVTLAAGNGTAGFSGDNGLATNAELNSSGGIAVDSAGNVFIADSQNNRVRRVSDGVIATVAGSGTCTRGPGPPCTTSDNVPATSAYLLPNGIAIDSGGNLYIIEDLVDAGPSVHKVSNGVFTTVAVTWQGGANLPVHFVSGVAIDAVGNLYIACDNVILELSGGVTTIVAGNGTQGFGGDNGPATAAELNQPAGVAVNPAGNLFVADFYNNRIRKVSGGSCVTGR